MGLTGSRVGDPNYIFRFSLIVFIGITLFGVALSWRASLLLASEYQDMPVTHEQLEVKKKNEAKQKLLQAALQKKLIQNQTEE